MELSEHAYALKEVFTYLNYQYDYNWGSPSLSPYHIEEDWLNLSAGVIEVKIVTNLHEEIWCGTVLEFEKTRSLGWSRLVESLTRFNFAWGAMERYIKNDNFKFEKECSINGAKELLCEQYWDENYFEQYDENVKKLYSLMKQFMLDEIPGDYDKQKFYSRGIRFCLKTISTP